MTDTKGMAFLWGKHIDLNAAQNSLSKDLFPGDVFSSRLWLTSLAWGPVGMKAYNFRRNFLTPFI